MLNTINSNVKNAFLVHKINGINYLVGSISFRIINNELYSYIMYFLYTKIKKHPLGYKIYDTPIKKDLNMYIPCFDLKSGQIGSMLQSKEIDVGMEMYINTTLYNTSTGYNIREVSSNSDINELHIFVVFEPESVTFYDRNVVLVNEFYIPNTDIFNDIIRHLVKRKVIDEKLGEKQKQEYQKIYSKLEKILR